MQTRADRESYWAMLYAEEKKQNLTIIQTVVNCMITVESESKGVIIKVIGMWSTVESEISLGHPLILRVIIDPISYFSTALLYYLLHQFLPNHFLLQDNYRQEQLSQYSIHFFLYYISVLGLYYFLGIIRVKVVIIIDNNRKFTISILDRKDLNSSNLACRLSWNRTLFRTRILLLYTLNYPLEVYPLNIWMLKNRLRGVEVRNDLSRGLSRNIEIREKLVKTAQWWMH